MGNNKMSEELNQTAQGIDMSDVLSSNKTPAARLEALKKRADLIGVSYPANIGADALAKKIQDKIEGKEETQEDTAELSTKSEAMRRMEMYNENMRQIRLRVTCLNPSKRDLPGEILTVSNSKLGTVRKFVPYGEATDNGYHVPYILYKMMKRRKFLQIRQRKDQRTGNMIREEQWVNEYALEVLPQLDQEALREMAHDQAASRSLS